MKRYTNFILIFLVLLGFCGCRKKNTDYLEPVTFYFCNDISDTNMSSDDFHNIFVAEIHEGAGYTNNLLSFLSLYFTGPSSASLVSPFPTDTAVISYQMEEDHVCVVLSDSLASIDGLDLTIACTCLSMTVMEFTGCDSVEISLESSPLGNGDAIVMSKDMLVLSDSTQMIPEE